METKNERRFRVYEKYSLIVGVGAIMTFLFFFVNNFLFGLEYCLFDPYLNKWIQGIETILGLSVIPYYFIRILK